MSPAPAGAAGTAPATWRRHWGVALLLLVGALVYGRSLGAYGMLMWDEAEYASLARSLAHGDGYVGAAGPERLRPPLLPLAGAAAIALHGAADDRAVGYATIALALLALLVVYAAGSIAYDAATGLLAAGILAWAPWFWGATANFLSEIPLLACFSAALFCWTFGLERSSRWFYAAWTCAGLALLTRYTALLLAPLFAILAASAWLGGGAPRARVLSRDFLVAPLLGLLVVAPWLARQWLVFGDPLVGVWRAGSQLQTYLPGVTMPATYYLVGLPAMLSLPVIGLLAAGVVWAVQRGDRLAVDCLLVILFVLGWFSWYRYKEPRLVSAMLPAAALLAAAGLTRGLLGGRHLPTAAAALLVSLLGLANAPAAGRAFAAVRTLGYPSFLDAMAFVRQHSAPGALLIGANRPQIFWYAERRVADFPAPEELPPLLAQAEWVVVTNFERGQQGYVSGLVDRLPSAAFTDGSAARFSDGRYTTFVVRADRLASP